jgi:hypothetical protein
MSIIPKPEIEDMLDTLCTNPDVSNFSALPDGVRGSATVSRQKKTIQLGFAGSTVYDVWIVEWPEEPLTNNNLVANYYVTEYALPAVGFGNVGQICTADNLSIPGWDDAGLATSLQIGGLCIYYMNVGFSPFPSNVQLGQPGSGPYAPIVTQQILFGEDLFHDFARVLGSNWEYVDQTSKLNQQGSIISGAWESVSGLTTQLTLGTTGDASGRDFANLTARTFALPPGDSSNLTKNPHSRSAASATGLFALTKLDMANNKPQSGFGVCDAFISISDHPLCNGKTLMLVCTNASRLTEDTASHAIAAIAPISALNTLVYPTAREMSCTKIAGLSSNWSSIFTREIITQCFTDSNSKYVAFAKPSWVPANSQLMDDLINTMDTINPFAPSASNFNGKFAKGAKAAFKKVAQSPLAKMAVNIAKPMLPPVAQQALDLAGKAKQIVKLDKVEHGDMQRILDAINNMKKISENNKKNNNNNNNSNNNNVKK